MLNAKYVQFTLDINSFSNSILTCILLGKKKNTWFYLDEIQCNLFIL